MLMQQQDYEGAHATTFASNPFSHRQLDVDADTCHAAFEFSLILSLCTPV